ncbi:MAG TPA: Dyp-type peroxidase [Mycobacteriales bacterium]|nr:Dyp-type peroxidase [Mycobacteriales bacterium]
MSRPPQPQPILTELTSAAIFLVAAVDDGGEEAVRGLLADLADLTRSVAFRALDGRLSCVVGIGSELFDRLFVGPRPAELHPFGAIVGPRHTAVTTTGDLMFHIRAEHMDLCFELADQLTTRLAGAATIVDEVHGFRYFDQRDLLGFVDGTANPTGYAAANAVLIEKQDLPYQGGSYVIVQKYLHDMAAWNSLSVEDQERAIGRTKLSDIELADDVKPANSHVARTTIVDANGNEQDIVRDNMPFGRMENGERGTYFIGYAASPALIEQMLNNMFLGDDAGNTDRILDFSTAVTGSLYFVPSQDFLDDLPDAPAPVTAEDRPEQSLGIGSLRD